ncbi:MAG: GNAT family N-acetyltransferase [Anaerolineae bacterium]|nr:GNAT family N-acetyltransferase [Anaerolineae bacterium]MEB2288931.1 GNAT family N-acetyltransferase [Anaerolineae bacterium]
MTRKALRLDILVRGIEADDWEDIAAIRESGNVVFHTLQLPYFSRDKIRDRLENPPADMVGLVAVVGGIVIGQLGLHLNAGRRAHTAALGMMVHGDYQLRGVGTALMEAAVELAERWMGITRLELEVYTDNTAGIALYKKFGFEVEGTLREYALRDGQYVDSYLMARVRE